LDGSAAQNSSVLARETSHVEASAFYTWVLHWHTQDGFPKLAKSAGLQTSAILDADGRPARTDADVFVFWLTAPEAAT